MINELIKRYPVLGNCKTDIEKAVNTIELCYQNGGKLLLCGNGGSAADCDHIVGELMKGFLKERRLSVQKKTKMQKNFTLDDNILDKLQRGLPAISLPSVTSLNTAFCNDVEPRLVYAQSLMSLASGNDVLFTISTSGNSENIVCAAKVAKALGLTVIALTGDTGGQLKSMADVSICVPENETYKVQELHLPVYHCICAEIEDRFFAE